MKKKTIKSAVPIYLAAAVWLLMGAVWPASMLKAGTLLLAAVLSAAAYIVGSRIFPGKVVEVRESANSGNAEVNRQIEEGREILDRIAAHNDALPDPVISEKLKRMTDAGEAIFSALEKDVGRASQVRRFMNYYLPTTEKLMAGYRELEASPAKGENIINAMKAVENSLTMIAEAFEKQLDSLYRDQSYDMETEVSALETILASEGLVKKTKDRQEQKAQTGF